MLPWTSIIYYHQLWVWRVQPITCLEAALPVRMQVLWNGPERALRVSSCSVDIAIVEQESSNCSSVCAYACFRRQDDATEQARRLVVATQSLLRSPCRRTCSHNLSILALSMAGVTGGAIGTFRSMQHDRLVARFEKSHPGYRLCVARLHTM
jgi:hypothetical protein